MAVTKGHNIFAFASANPPGADIPACRQTGSLVRLWRASSEELALTPLMSPLDKGGCKGVFEYRASKTLPAGRQALKYYVLSASLKIHE